MSVCMEYERVVVCGERESRKKGEKEKGAPKDPPRTKWSPLILRRHCKVHPSPGSSFSFPPSCVSFSRCLSCILALSSFLVFLSRFLCLRSLFSFSFSRSLSSTLSLQPVQVFPHAHAKSTELLGIIAAPGLDSRREYISSTLGGKLCPWSMEERRREDGEG